MKKISRRVNAIWFVLLTLALVVSGCGGGGGGSAASASSSYTVGGTVTGLTGTGLVLRNNGGDDLAVSANGTFTFATVVANGAAYAVTVKTQPTGPMQTCTASNNTGTITGASVTGVSVVCSTNTYTVSGIVSGLTGTALVLQNNGVDDLALSSDGTFTFPTKVSDGGQYNVTVMTQPAGQLCLVTNGTGTVASANIANITVACGPSGLAAYYNCNGNVNDSIGSANGTLSSGFTYTADRHGNSASACNFNGVDSKVTVSTPISSLTSTGFSLSLWAKSTLGAACATLVDASPRFLIWESGSVYFTAFSGTTNTSPGVVSPQGVWTHYVFTYDDTTFSMKVYRDGVFISDTNKGGAGGGLQLSTLNLGQSPNPCSGTGYWSGALDDVRIFDRSLSASEALQIYQFQN